MKSRIALYTLLMSLFPVLLSAQPPAYDLSGTVKTLEKEKRDTREVPSGDLKVADELKVLEVNARRMTPTVSGEVTIRWAVLISDMRGRLRPVTLGEQQIVMEVGIPAKLESDAFSLTSVRLDNNTVRGNDIKREQEIEGYAIMVLDAAGQELAAKFQPKSIEKKARQVMTRP